MTPAEAAALLTICAAYDNRRPDSDAAKAWSLALDGYRFEDCRDAIVAHYRTSREWIMPADVIRAVKKLRTGRLEDAPVIDPPSGLDPDPKTGGRAYLDWLAGVRKAIADGHEPVEAYTPTRSIGSLRGVVRALPEFQAPVVPRRRDREHAERLAAARAELPPPAPIPAETNPGLHERVETARAVINHEGEA